MSLLLGFIHEMGEEGGEYNDNQLLLAEVLPMVHDIGGRAQGSDANCQPSSLTLVTLFQTQHMHTIEDTQGVWR